MPLIQTVTVGGRLIDLTSFRGEVVEDKKWSTTQVAGGGGGTNVGSGLPNPVTVSSVSTTHDQFFVRSDDGQERAFEMANTGIALRKGHRVTVLWGNVRGIERGSYIAVYNHTTGALTPFPNAVSELALPPMPTSTLIGYVVGFFGICFYGLGFIVLIVLFIQRSKLKKRLLATLRPPVDAAIALIRQQS
jgi:hypothetical protein